MLFFLLLLLEIYIPLKNYLLSIKPDCVVAFPDHLEDWILIVCKHHSGDLGVSLEDLLLLVFDLFFQGLSVAQVMSLKKSAKNKSGTQRQRPTMQSFFCTSA